MLSYSHRTLILFVLTAFTFNIDCSSAQPYCYGKYAEQYIVEFIERCIEQYKSYELKKFLNDNCLILTENNSLFLKEKSKKVSETIHEKQMALYYPVKLLSATAALMLFITLFDPQQEYLADRLCGLGLSSLVFLWPWKTDRAQAIKDIVENQINKPY